MHVSGIMKSTIPQGIPDCQCVEKPIYFCLEGD